MERPSGKQIGIIILAGGASSRLGMPKQLLKSGGRTLIVRVCEAALSLDVEKVVVVTGAFAEKVSAEIEALPVQILFNELWEEGMASSIRKGVEELSADNIAAVMILVCDQVNLGGTLLARIRDLFLEDPNCKIVYCNYGNQVGVPALFDRTIFPELTELRGDTGAKGILQRHLSEAREISFPGGDIDMDHPEDMAHLSV